MSAHHGRNDPDGKDPGRGRSVFLPSQKRTRIKTIEEFNTPLKQESRGRRSDRFHDRNATLYQAGRIDG